MNVPAKSTQNARGSARSSVASDWVGGIGVGRWPFPENKKPRSPMASRVGPETRVRWVQTLPCGWRLPTRIAANVHCALLPRRANGFGLVFMCGM